MTPRALNWRGALNFRHEATLPASPSDVFSLLADVGSWPRWFPGMKSARWTSEKTACVGARREVVLGSIAFEEEFLAWDVGQRFAFTMLSSNRPLVSSMIEEISLEETAEGTRCVYAVTGEVTLALRPTRAIVRRAMDPTFAAGLGGLFAHFS